MTHPSNITKKAHPAAPPGEDNTLSASVQKKLPRIGGSNSRHFSELLLGQAIAACRLVSKDLHPGKAVLDALAELNPKDPLEAALMSQALCIHMQAMQILDKAASSQFPEVREQWLRQATKLMSLFARQLDSISKYQRKGGQYMTIHHVTLEPGSNAVLGSVKHTAGGVAHESNG